jgi:hypothetical protein
MLQAVMELQRGFGEFGTKIDLLASDVKTHGEKLEKFGDKLDRLRIWAARVAGGAAVVGFIIWIVSMWREPIANWLLSQ